MENKKAYSKALRMLSRRRYSERELRDKLSGFAAEEEIDEILQECGRRKYLDDSSLAEFLTGKHINNGKGYFYISSILNKRGIPGEIIERIRDNFDFNRELAVAEEFFLKNRKRKKLSSLLFSLKNRGFSPHTINRLMNKYVKRNE